MFSQEQSKFKRFKKTYKSNKMKGFEGFDGKVKRMPTEPAPAPAVEKVAPQLTNDHERRIANDLKDEELARRVVNLQNKNPFATVIEALVMDWLDKNLATYVYQARVNGGYRPGGNVPDFLVRNQNREWVAMLVNGNYWHSVPGKQNDTADKLRTVGSIYQGSKIGSAVILWESRLMRGKQARDEAMLAAMSGVELGA